MGAYNYRALDSKGRELKGVLEGDSERHIRQQLRDQKLAPLDINEVFQQAKEIKGVSTRHRIAGTELTLITQQLSTLLTASMPLEEALLTTSAQTQKLFIKSILLRVRARVLEGHSFATALADFPSSFTELYRATVAAGEQVGRLDVVLLRLSEYLERQQAIKQKIQMALVYPALLTLISLSIVTFLLVYVVPKMVGIFSDLNQDLPTLTKVLINVSQVIKIYWPYALTTLCILIFLIRYYLKREKVRRAYHRLLLNIPAISYFVKTVNTARFLRTFGILSNAGVPVLEAMRVAAKLLTSIPIQEGIADAVLKVREGTDISHAIEHTGYFSPMAIHLIASGESSGKLELMLERAANYQDQAVTRLIDTGLTLFEPLMILFMGLIILFIVLAILLPIFEMNQLIS